MTVTDSVYGWYQDIQTAHGFFRVFHSISFGDLVVIFLMLVAIVLFILKWVFEVSREGDW